MESGFAPKVDRCIDFVNSWFFITDESTPSHAGLRGLAVNFLLDGSWDMIPLEWRVFFEDVDDLEDVLRHMNRLQSSFPFCPASLMAFLDEARACCSPIAGVAPDVVAVLKDVRGIKAKKRSEIAIFSSVVANHCKKVKCNRVVDIGAGQGHLARTLAVSFGLDVIAIERDIGNVQRGEERAAQGANLAFVAANIEGPEDISKIVGDSDAVVVSLHACGTLSTSVQLAYSMSDKIVGMLCVPCCYSKLVTLVSDYFVSDYVRSRVRKLAEGSLLNASCSPILEVGNSTIWRCLLALLCARFNLAPLASITTSKAKSFLEYVRLNGIKDLTDEEVEIFYNLEIAKASRRVKAFWTLKNVVGHVLERLVLLDRCLAAPGSELVQLFDPTVSPRATCLIASKK